MNKRRNARPIEPEIEFVQEQINPSSMVFHFALTDGECHEKRTGTCSLDKCPASGEQHDGEAGHHYCQNLYSQILQYGFRHPVDIIKFHCGHYGFNDGQHRVCIAKKKGLELPAVVSREDGQNCGFCAPRWKSQNGDLR